MNLDTLIKKIQVNCDAFITSNSTNIHKSLSTICPITAPYETYRLNNLPEAAWGVYAFFFKLKIDILEVKELERIWRKDTNGDPLICPKVIVKHFRKLIKEQWYCIYVGKSENLIGRISQHIHQLTADSTYSLKLSRQVGLHKIAQFGYASYIIKQKPTSDKEGLKILLVVTEKHLRNQLKPLFGKQ
jgi:hypothetical protein